MEEEEGELEQEEGEEEGNGKGRRRLEGRRQETRGRAGKGEKVAIKSMYANLSQ